MSNTITKMNEQTYVIDEGGVRFFLLIGEKQALLIDSGMETHDAKNIAEGLTDLPIALINTHTDRDHTGSNDQFDEFYMHPSEAPNYYKGSERTNRFVPVWDGDVIDLGGRELRIIALPGHTPGSIAILDTKYRCLFSGDPIQDGRIFMFGPYREMHAYRESLIRLQKYDDLYDDICPSHGTIPVKKSLIPVLIKASEDLMEGRLTREEIDLFGQKVGIYGFGAAAFLYNE